MAQGALATVGVDRPKVPTTFAADGKPSTLDYFVANKQLALLLGGASLFDSVVVPTHRAVQVTLHVDMRSKLVKVLKKQPRPPGKPVFGPHKQPPDWGELLERYEALLQAQWGHHDFSKTLPQHLVGEFAPFLQELLDDFFGHGFLGRTRALWLGGAPWAEVCC